MQHCIQTRCLLYSRNKVKHNISISRNNFKCNPYQIFVFLWVLTRCKSRPQLSTVGKGLRFNTAYQNFFVSQWLSVLVLDCLGFLFSERNKDKIRKELSTIHKEGKDKLCCAHMSSTTYLLHISLLAVTQHTWTHILHPTELWQGAERKRKVDKKKKTLRAVSDLTGWVKHSEHRSLLMSTQTRTLTDVSIHLECHTHTPPRDLTSSVSQLNYSSPSSLSISLFLPFCLSPLCLWDRQQQRHMFGMLSLSTRLEHKTSVCRSLRGHTRQMRCLMF